jgi:hypothetical protein
MSTSVSASGSKIAKIEDQAKLVTKKYGLDFAQGKINDPKTPPLQYGEIEFTGLGGHRAHYCIVPKEEESADGILRWMFTDSRGWRMKTPNLLLSMYGGRDHYINWANSETLKNREAWGDLDDYKFQHKFRSRLEEIAGGVCQAVIECGGWFDFGRGGRGGMNEVIKDGLKVYWSAFGSLAGHKERSIVFAVRMLDDTEGKESFLKCSKKVRSNIDGSGNPEPITERVMYPSVDPLIFPELTGSSAVPGGACTTGGSAIGSQVGDEDTSKEVSFEICSRFLSNAVTHVVFVQNVYVRDTLLLKLKQMATRAVIFANGNRKLVTPGVDGKILMEAMAGVPVVVLHNTGGAAEMLGADVMKKRQPGLATSDYGGFRLPENVPIDQFLILNPAKDSVEKVINKLTLVLSTVQDAEMMEVGYSKAEQNRILYAWEMFALFTYNAGLFRQKARIYFYTGMCISFLLTCMSITWEMLESGRSEIDSHFPQPFASQLELHKRLIRMCLYVFPIVTGFFLTMNSRFNPVGKFTALESGAVHIRSVIYQYRCRVGAYMPIKGANLDTSELVEDLCDKPDPNAAVEVLDATRKRKKKQEACRPKDISRRVLFSEELERINQDSTGADIQSDTLKHPPISLGDLISKILYNSNTVREQSQTHCEKFWNWLTACSTCCKRKKSNASRTSVVTPYARLNENAEALMDETNRLVWSKAGGDYHANPYMLEDDFLLDDGLSVITAEDYMFFRFLPLVQHHTQRSAVLTERVQILQVFQFFLTALLAGSAPLGFERWVPAFVALITFITGTLEFENYPAQLRNVNQSLECLKNLRIWWQSLSMVERRMPKNKEALVLGAEATVDSEISAWRKSLRTSSVKGSGAGGGADEEGEKDDDKLANKE